LDVFTEGRNGYVRRGASYRFVMRGLEEGEVGSNRPFKNEKGFSMRH